MPVALPSHRRAWHRQLLVGPPRPLVLDGRHVGDVQAPRLWANRLIRQEAEPFLGPSWSRLVHEPGHRGQGIEKRVAVDSGGCGCLHLGCGIDRDAEPDGMEQRQV